MPRPSPVALEHLEALPELVSNGHALDPSPHRLGRLTASDPAEPSETLLQRYEADGYLWLKGLLPRREVLDFRGYFFGQFKASGLLAPGSDPVEGRCNPQRIADEGTRKRLMEIVRSAAFKSFCLQPAALALPRRVSRRHVVPAQAQDAPLHAAGRSVVDRRAL